MSSFAGVAAVVSAIAGAVAGQAALVRSVPAPETGIGRPDMVACPAAESSADFGPAEDNCLPRTGGIPGSPALAAHYFAAVRRTTRIPPGVPDRRNRRCIPGAFYIRRVRA